MHKTEQMSATSRVFLAKLERVECALECLKIFVEAVRKQKIKDEKKES